MTISLIDRVLEPVQATRRNRREGREARAAHQSLRRELACYQTAGEIDDLLGSIKDEEGPDAQQVREILLDNLR